MNTDTNTRCKASSARSTVPVALCALLSSSLALAQAHQEVDESAVVALQAVTVTANKVEEKIKDVPQSVTLISGEALQEKGIRNVNDLMREIPNLWSAFAYYYADVNIRGLNASTFTNTNPVVLYVDGVAQSNQFAYDALLENVERVEVLRGPQSSLYGKDALGGVVNIITKTPKGTWSGQIGAEGVNRGGKELSATVTGPLLSDRLFLSFSGKVTAQNGWVTNSWPGMKAHADRQSEQRFSLGLRYQVSPDTQIRFQAARDDLTKHWSYGGLVPTGGDYAAYTRDAAERARFDQASVTKTLTNMQSLAIEHKFGDVTLNAVTTNKSVQLDGEYDADFGADPRYRGMTMSAHSTIATQTQEVRLSAGKTGQTRWVGGFYLENGKYRNPRYGGQYLLGDGHAVDMDAVSTTKSGIQAVFGQVMLPVAQRLELTLGGRYQRIKKTIHADFYMQPVGTTGAPPLYSLAATKTWGAFLPKAALSLELTPRWKAYVSVAKGYMPGGYNYFPQSSDVAQNSFGPQTSINYEMGLRSDLGRLYLSAALFHMDIRDVHVYSYDASTGKISTSNAGRAASTGVELEAKYWLSDQWQISGALGLTKATYKQYPNPAVNGNTIEKTPAYTANIGLQYTAGNGLYGRVDLRGQGKRYFNPENTLANGAYATVDLKAGYKTGPWEFYGYVRNLTDARYLAYAAELGNGTLMTFGEPRRLGVGVRYSF